MQAINELVAKADGKDKLLATVQARTHNSAQQHAAGAKTKRCLAKRSSAFMSLSTFRGCAFHI